MELPTSRRLLVVDDETSIASSLKCILEASGFEVETAMSAGEAIAKLKTESYQLVITDMSMEHTESGYEVLHAARNTECQPAVIIFTGFPSIECDWKQQGAQRLLFKPMAAKAMLREIEIVLLEHQRPTDGRSPVQ